MNSNVTELDQVVHTHRESCESGWPRGFALVWGGGVPNKGYTGRLHPELHHIEYPLGGRSVNCEIRRKKGHEEFLHPSPSRMQNFLHLSYVLELL